MSERRSTVLVTDAGRGSAIAIIRSLGRRGWRVIAADSSPRSLGFRSRYTAGRLVYPAPEDAPRETISAIKAAAEREGVELIIPVTDAILLPLSEARAEFGGLCAIAMPTPEQLAVVTNKLKTIDLAQELGVPVPLTRVVETVGEALALPITDWPVVLKPQASRLYRDQASVEHFEVCYAHTRDELARQMARFEGRCPVLLQSYYPGEGHGVELLLHEGRPLAAFQHKRLHEVPITGGASSFRQSVALDPALYKHSARLMSALNWTGLAMVEFKVGAEGGKLMEINGRIWGSLPLAVFSGMDFPARLASLYRGGPPPALNGADTRYRAGVKARNVERDLVWVASVLLGRKRSGSLPVPPRRAALIGLAGMLNPLTRSDLLARDDPLPGLAELPAIVAKQIGKAVRRG